MFKIFCLKPTKQRISKKDIYGFDIETYDKNKKFLCASLYGYNYKKVFSTRKAVIKELKQRRFRNSIITATNLGFDFFGTFYKQEELQEFHTQFRGSDLIFAKTYLGKGYEFSRTPPKHKAKTLLFIDTMNYGRLSVKQAGNILNILKLEAPKDLGQKPTNSDEWMEMIKYNLKDSEISFKLLHFLIDSFQKLGATFKYTIASTSMSLFKNQYLKDTYYRHDADKLLLQFKGYYGGRCECFYRGFNDRKHFYYDFNSLYPAVMREGIYPDPNTLRINKKNDLSFIDSYEGFAEVSITCPHHVFPLLPYRYDNKLLFPVGSFKGTYTNVELRKAIQEGYTITKVHRNIYFKKSCRPFEDFVKDLYAKRKLYKDEKNSMEYVIKIVMNSLYGKFGEKFLNRDNIIPIPTDYKELEQYDHIEPIGDFIRIKKDFTTPKAHCIPSWAAYVTAYGRIKLYDILKTSEPVYCDTDSIITQKKFHNSDELGKLKLENTINKMIIVKPKFYMLDNSKHKIFKIKGIGKKICATDFRDILKFQEVTYDKFMRFKESIRRGFIPNEIQPICKHLSLEDNKRVWKDEFNIKEWQTSSPIDIRTYTEKEKKVIQPLTVLS